MKPILFVCLTACLAGCADLAKEQCSGSDWYQVGARDGQMGAMQQGDLYARSCGAAADLGRYQEGWQAGFLGRPLPSW